MKKNKTDEEQLMGSPAKADANNLGPLHPQKPTERTSQAPFSGERRSAPRVAIEAEIGLHSETNFYTGFTEDLSDGGLFIATYDSFPVGAKLVVKFCLPEGHEIMADGRVVWVRDAHDDVTPGMGVQFERLRPEDHDAIMRFTRARPALFYTG